MHPFKVFLIFISLLGVFVVALSEIRAQIFYEIQEPIQNGVGASDTIGTQEYYKYCERKDEGTNQTQAELISIFEEAEAKWQIPSQILKVMAYQESGWEHFIYDRELEKWVIHIGKDPNGISCGIGLMQLTGKTAEDFDEFDRLFTDPIYNLEAGFKVLDDKWNGTPVIGNNERYMYENWYYAIWGYNGGCHAIHPDCNHYPEDVLADMGKDKGTYWSGISVTSPNIASFKNGPKSIYPIPTPTPIHYTDYWLNIGTYAGEEPHANPKSQFFLDYWGKEEFFDAPAFNKLGVPFDDGKGNLVHSWDGVILQNFRQAHPDKQRFGDGYSALALNKDQTKVFLIKADFWQAYKNNNGPTAFGAPLAEAYEDPKNQGIMRQDFESNCMLWDDAKKDIRFCSQILPEEWVMHQYDKYRSGYAPNAKDIQNPEAPKYKIIDANHSVAQPLVKDGVAYTVTTDGKAMAFDARSFPFAMVWGPIQLYDPDDKPVTILVTPMIVGDELIVVTNSALVYALKLSNGALSWGLPSLWKFDDEYPTYGNTSPIIVNDMLTFTIGSNQKILDLLSPNKELIADSFWYPWIDSSFTTDNSNQLYIVDIIGDLYVMDLREKPELFIKLPKFSGGFSIVGYKYCGPFLCEGQETNERTESRAVAWGDNTLFVKSDWMTDPHSPYYAEADTGTLYAIDTARLLKDPYGQNLSLIWKKEIGVGKNAPVYRNGIIYVAGSRFHGDNEGNGYFTGSVYAFDGRSGVEKWRIPIDDVASVTIGRNTLYVAEFNNGVLRMYNIDGSMPILIKDVLLGGFLFSPPAIAGDKLYITSWDNTLPNTESDSEVSPDAAVAKSKGKRKIKHVVSVSDLEKIYKPGVSLVSYTQNDDLTTQDNPVNTTLAILRDECPLPIKPIWIEAPKETVRDGGYILTWDTAGIHTLEESRDEFFMGATVKITGTESTAWFSGKDDGVYYYRVWTENTCGYGPSSAIISVIVQHNQEPYTFLWEPENYETVYTSLPELSWRFNDNDASDSQTAWEVILSNSPNFDGSVFHYTGGEDGATSWIPPLLFDEGSYYWKTRARDERNAWSDWTLSNQFIIQKKFFSAGVAKFPYPHYGVAWGDFDGDNDSDLYLAGYGASDALLGNDRGIFYDSTAERGLYDGRGGYGGGAVWGDYDNDGDADLLVANLNTVDYLYRNDGARFTEVSGSSGMPYTYTTYAPAFVDYDSNGYLDIILMVYGGAVVYKNAGDGAHFQSAPENDVIDEVFGNVKFDEPKISEISGERGLQPNLQNLPKISVEKLNALLAKKKELDTESVYNGIVNYYGIPYAQAWGDYDNDGDLDLYISNFGYTYDTANGAYNVLYNNYYGYFNDVTSQTGLLQQRDKTWASDWGDYDGDGFLDLAVFNCGSSFLYHNGNGYFTNATGATSFDKAIGCAVGGSFIDYDNDGDLDIQVVYTDADRLFRNDNGKFIDVTQDVFLSDTGGESYANANADYDSDGDVDILATTLGDGAPSYGHDWLFTNPGFSNTFIRVIPKLAGLNRLDYGAKVYADTDGDHDFSTGEKIMRYLKPTEGKGSQGEGVLHIGVKDASTVDVRVQFTNRAAVLKYNVPTGKTITITSSDLSDPFPGASVPNKPSEISQFAGDGDDILWGSYTRERFPHFSFRLSDSKIANTLGYDINIDDDGVYEGDAGDLLNFTSDAEFANGSAPVYIASKELSDGSYYWRVKAVNSEGAASEWVYAYEGMSSFTIDETSPKPPLFFAAKEEADAIALAWALDGEEGEQGTEKTKSMPAEIARQPFVPGEFLVKFKPGKERRLNALSKILSKEKAIERHVSGISRVVLKDARDFDEVFKKYERDTDVLSVSPNYLITIDELPNDAEFPKLWGLHNTGQTGGTPDADIDAPEAWNITQVPASPAIVAVIDTGVDYTHPDLSQNIWTNEGEIAGNGVDDDGNNFIDDIRGWDMTMCNERDGNGVCLSPKERDNDPMDEHGHGTHVSGTIGAVGWNEIGVIGVNPYARIMPVRFMDKNGVGTTADAIDAIYYAAQNGARVINASFGGGGFSQPFLDAILFAREKGALFVAAAGNNGQNSDTKPQYPASYDADNIIAVAATDARDALAAFSNYGSESVDIGAPGVDIVSTVPRGSYTFSSGTSMAAPHVSGAAALLFTEQPTFSFTSVREMILSTADRAASLEGKISSGGRLNLAATLERAKKNVDIARFVIYRGVEPFEVIDDRASIADIADTWMRSYIDTATDRGVTYYYALVAEDAAGNKSAPIFTDVSMSLPDLALSGFSWSSSIGWISFSCKNREQATGKTCKDVHDNSFDPTINLVDYGVSVDGITNAISGYAWNDNIGWISFNREDTGNPPDSPYNEPFSLPSSSALASYWSFDEGEINQSKTVKDDSGNGNTGTLVGNQTNSDFVAGVSGTGLNFDGVDDYVHKSSPSFAKDAQGSVSLWVKFDTLITEQLIWSINVNGATDDEFFLDFRGDGNKTLQIILLVNGVGTFTLETASNIITDTNWHHIVVTSDSSTTSLYIDAVEKTLNTLAGTNSGQWFDDATQADIFTLGALTRATPIVHLDGSIDELRVYSTALTQDEVNALFENPPGAIHEGNSIAYLEGHEKDDVRPITGWARAITGKRAEEQASGSWDGWIKLSGNAEDGTPYGLSLNKDAGELSGWMYGGDIIGWISANCKNRNNCEVVSYNVKSLSL